MFPYVLLNKDTEYIQMYMNCNYGNFFFLFGSRTIKSYETASKTTKIKQKKKKKQILIICKK